MDTPVPVSRWLTRQPYPSIVDGEEVSTVEDYRDASVTRAQYYRTEWLNVDLSAPARVSRGTMYVQRFYAETCLSMRVDDINLGRSDLCVLGQIYGEYERAPEVMFGTRSFRESHGFVPLHFPGGNWAGDAQALNALWRQAFKTWLHR